MVSYLKEAVLLQQKVSTLRKELKLLDIKSCSLQMVTTQWFTILILCQSMILNQMLLTVEEIIISLLTL